ncbi:MAG: ABC transporter permease [Chloroflexi bacterium]|nr:ABC transporter permease [Chloroflexota bacterium]
MNPRRVRAVAKRIAEQFRRDRRSLGLLIGAPILVMSLVGALWGSSTAQVSRIVVATDRAPAPQLVAALRRSPALAVTETTVDEAMRRLRDATVDAVISTRVGFVSTEIVVVMEGSDPFRSGTTLQSIQRAVLAAVSVPPIPGAPPAGPPPVVVEYLHGGPDHTLLDLLAPLLIGVFAFFFTFLLSAVSFLRERTSGTLERLMATPLRRAELVVGYLAGFSVFALIQAVVIIAFTVLVLNVKYSGSLATIFLIEAMLVIVSVSLGLFISAFARTELQAVQFIPVVLVPQIFLSGLLVPVDQLPDVLRPFAAIMPLTYSNEALRGVMVRGLEIGDPVIVRDLLVLAAFGVVTIAGAIASIRREVA